jgi:type VI secretion system protein ImpH
MLKRLLPQFKVEINDQVEHWVPSLESGTLGQQISGLGGGSVLGDRMLVVGGKLDLLIGPLDSSQCSRLLPGGDLAVKIQSVLETYLSPSLDYQLVLIVKSEKAPIQALMGETLALGKTTWLGENPEMERQVRLTKKQLKQGHQNISELANAA